MADEQNEQDKAQADAREKVDVPGDVKTSDDTADTSRADYFALMEKGKDMATKYGEPDFAHLLAKVGSDGVFAQRLVEDFVSGGDTAVKSTLLPDSPQEKNVTGILDHTGDVATKVKREGQADFAPESK